MTFSLMVPKCRCRNIKEEGIYSSYVSCNVLFTQVPRAFGAYSHSRQPGEVSTSAKLFLATRSMRLANVKHNSMATGVCSPRVSNLHICAVHKIWHVPRKKGPLRLQSNVRLRTHSNPDIFTYMSSLRVLAVYAFL